MCKRLVLVVGLALVAGPVSAGAAFAHEATVAVAAKGDAEAADGPGYHLKRGLSYMAQERFGDAEREFVRVVQMDPDAYWGWNNLGYALHRQGRLHEAATVYDRAMGVAGSDQTSHLNFGNMLLEAGQWPGAAWVYRDALKRGDRTADAHWGLAVALLELGRLDEAYLEARLAAGLGAPKAALHGLLARIHAGRGELEAAINEGRAAVRAEDAPEHHWRLAGLYERDGQAKAAAASYQAFLALSPEGRQAAEARWRLRTLRWVTGE